MRSLSPRPSARSVARGGAVATCFLVATSLAVSPAFAGAPGVWTQLSSGTGVSPINEPGIGRTSGDLTAVWEQNISGGTAAIRSRVVSTTGVSGSASTVVSGWQTLVTDPKVIDTGGGNRATVFSGIRGTVTGAPYTGGSMYSATSAGPAPWLLAPDPTFPSVGGSPYASYGTGVVRIGTTIVTSYPLNSDIHVTDTAGRTDLFHPPAGAGVLNTSLTRDAVSGALWLTYYSLGSSNSKVNQGTFAQQIRPTVGARIQLPGSVTTNQYGSNALSPDQAVATAARAGGGVYVAYGMGYPTITTIRVQRLGSASHIDVAAPQALKMSLTASGGRLWLSWAAPDGRVLATRSNLQASRFGVVRNIRGPGPYITRLASDGSTGRLDVVVNSSSSTGVAQIFHTQVLAGLSLSLSKAKFRKSKGGTLTVTVTDAGTAVAGAVVKVGSVARSTNSAGKARFKVKKKSKKYSKSVVANRSGYAGARSRIRVV